MGSFSVLIVGAGRIGAFFDTPDSGAVLSHAHAFSSHAGFRIAGFVDADPRQAERAARLWGGRSYRSLAEAASGRAPDVIVVAAPDECHYRLLQEAASLPVRLVLAEKPLAGTVAEAEILVELYRERGISLGLNYTRRYLPQFLALREKIGAGAYGRFLAGNGYYGKGTLHNGSHLVDLLRFLLGELSVTETLGQVVDWRAEEPTCSAVLEPVSGGRFTMQAVDSRCYTVFELDLCFEQARLRLVDSAYVIEEYRVEESPLFAGYRVLGAGSRGAGGLSNGLGAVAEAVHAHLDRGAALPCSGADGLQAMAICAAILGRSA